jgi:hypothetical protein
MIPFVSFHVALCGVGSGGFLVLSVVSVGCMAWESRKFLLGRRLGRGRV